MSHEQDFDCYGFFRRPEEILIAPTWLKTESDEHPFKMILDVLETTTDIAVPKLSDVPAIEVITLANRMIEFQASWTTNKKQLDLKVGVGVIRRLLASSSETDLIRLYPATCAEVGCGQQREEQRRGDPHRAG